MRQVRLLPVALICLMIPAAVFVPAGFAEPIP